VTFSMREREREKGRDVPLSEEEAQKESEATKK
jgi:hypothetical protein